MKAVLKLDTLNNLLTFSCNEINLSFSVSPNITQIYSLDGFDVGYMVIQTNMGEEYIDLLGMLELEEYDVKFINKVKQVLKEIHLEDIRLGVETSMVCLTEVDENSKPILKVVNLNNTTQVLKCYIYGRTIRLKSSNMSETNKYKILLYIERNKNLILEHLGIIYRL